MLSGYPATVTWQLQLPSVEPSGKGSIADSSALFLIFSHSSLAEPSRKVFSCTVAIPISALKPTSPVFFQEGWI
jgi:hypothetical protein